MRGPPGSPGTPPHAFDWFAERRLTLFLPLKGGGQVGVRAGNSAPNALAQFPPHALPPPERGRIGGGPCRQLCARAQPKSAPPVLYSASSFSSPASSPARIFSAIRPAFCRMAASILLAISALALRKVLAFSRPWPMRWLS